MPNTALSPIPLLLLIAVSPPGRDDEGTLVERVSDERAMETVRELVDGFGPRMGGTEAGDRAAAWLVARFRSFGVEAEIVEGAEQWCHSEESWEVVAHATAAGGGDPERVVLASAWPYGFSPTAEGRAPLSLELEGDGATLLETNRRPRRGAPKPAVVLVDGSTTADGAYPKCRALRRDPDGFPVFGLSRPEGARLRGWLEEQRTVEIEFSIEATIRRARPKTVVARIPAREGAAPGFLLYCAHGDSDSGGPGANDNGSGVAIVLEIARAWARAIAEGKEPPPAREVRFAVWGTEIASTRHYLENHVTDEDPILGVINYDQAGFGSGAEQLNVEPDDLEANVGMVREVLGVLDDFGGKDGFPARWATNKSLGGTDSYVFSGSRRFRSGKIPALTLFTSAWDSRAEHPRTKGMPGESWSERDRVNVDYDIYYHSAGDVAENTTDVEPHNMGWCARVGLLAGKRWLEGDGK